MSYYSALITGWNLSSASSGALPSGVTGTSLFGLTTANKITAVNGWTIVGPAVPCEVTPSQIFNCIDTVAHANALTTTQLQVLQFLGGSGLPIFAPPGGIIRSWIQNVFSGQTTTLANFSALVAQFDNPPIPWVTAPNGGALGTMVNSNDVQIAGLS